MSMSSNGPPDVCETRELNPTDFESDRYIDGFYFDEVVHGDSSEEFLLELATREYFRSEFENFMDLFLSSKSKKKKKKGKTVRGASRLEVSCSIV